MKLTNIYFLCSPVDGTPKYIGKSNNVNKRLKEHLQEKTNNKKNTWIRSLIKKGLYPSIEILDVVLYEEWKFWEQYYISLFKSWGFNLKNSNDGGIGSNNPNEETRFKQGSHRRGKKYEELFGLKKAIELKKDITKRNLERPPVSEETKLKISKNNAKYWLNHIYPPEKLKPMQEAHKIPILQFDLNNDFIKEYESATQASEETNVDISSIIKVCRKNRNKAGNFIWKYK